MVVYRGSRQVVDPILAFDQANVLAEEVIAVTEGGSTTDDEEFGLGAGQGDVDTAPVA